MTGKSASHFSVIFEPRKYWVPLKAILGSNKIVVDAVRTNDSGSYISRNFDGKKYFVQGMGNNLAHSIHSKDMTFPSRTDIRACDPVFDACKLS